MSIFKKKNKQAGEIDRERLPRHIAIIMDGNGRWAKRRGLPRTAGHASGAETFRRIANYCKSIGIKYLTVYAFSTENWKRPKEEVDAIMSLLEKYLMESIEEMQKNRVRIKIIGDTTVLSPELQQLILENEQKSKKYNDCQANICINYGGRDEILRAAEAYAKNYAKTGQKLDEGIFSQYMFTDGIPDPDLIIRPSGEYRLSNFLLWQSAYSELYFTDVLWPDFNTRELDRAILAYQSRDRRFGAIK